MIVLVHFTNCALLWLMICNYKLKHCYKLCSVEAVVESL